MHTVHVFNCSLGGNIDLLKYISEAVDTCPAKFDYHLGRWGIKLRLRKRGEETLHRTTDTNPSFLLCYVVSSSLVKQRPTLWSMSLRYGF